MKLDPSQLNWQHYVMMVAGVAGAAATGVMSKVGTICASTSCATTATSVCEFIIAVTGAIVLVFGHTSPSILGKS